MIRHDQATKGLTWDLPPRRGVGTLLLLVSVLGLVVLGRYFATETSTRAVPGWPAVAFPTVEKG